MWKNIGGPLDQGDIEELGNKLLVVCPWHSFDFDLKDGMSSTGLKVKKNTFLMIELLDQTNIHNKATNVRYTYWKWPTLYKYTISVKSYQT